MIARLSTIILIVSSLLIYPCPAVEFSELYQIEADEVVLDPGKEINLVKAASDYGNDERGLSYLSQRANLSDRILFNKNPFIIAYIHKNKNGFDLVYYTKGKGTQRIVRLDDRWDALLGKDDSALTLNLTLGPMGRKIIAEEASINLSQSVTIEDY